MTSQEFVCSIYPRAIAKRYTTNSGEGYYLIWSLRYGSDAIRLGEGKTASSAWVNARENINKAHKAEGENQ